MENAAVHYRLLAGSFFLIVLLFPFVCCFPGLLKPTDPPSGLDSRSAAAFGFPSAGVRSSEMPLTTRAVTLALPWVLLARVLSRLPLEHRPLLQKNCGWGLEKQLPLLPSLSHWEISHLALEVVGFHSGPRSFTCPQLYASPLDENGNGGSAVFHPQEETHFWHSLSSSTSLVGIPNVWSSPSGTGCELKERCMSFLKVPKLIYFLFHWCKKHMETYRSVSYTVHNNNSTPAPRCLESLITL